jgi:UrcA family protein
MKVLATFVLALGSIAPLATVLAAPATTVATERVSIQASNLNSTAGRASAESRIRAAARHVCQDSHDISVAARARQDQCYAKAVDDGLRQLNDIKAYMAASGSPSHSG